MNSRWLLGLLRGSGGVVLSGGTGLCGDDRSPAAR